MATYRVLFKYCAGCVGIKGPGLGRVIAGVVKKILRPKLGCSRLTAYFFLFGRKDTAPGA
jgi:hypothetical protein